MAPAQIAPVTIETTAQKPRRRGLCRSLRAHFHWRCLAGTALIHVCLTYVAWCHIKFYFYVPDPAVSQLYGPCSNAYRFVPLGFAALLYLIYLCECWHNRGKWDGIPVLSVSQFLTHVERIRGSTPVVWWKSVCYHYLRRTKHVTRYRNGDAVTATQVYYERVNSHTSGNVFMYDSCGVKDISKDVYDVDDFALTRVRFTKGFVFACVQAANDFEEQRTRFFNENEIRDDYMEVHEGLDFAECRFIESALVVRRDDKRLPFFMRSGVYWAACICLCGWPLRVFIDWRIAHLHYRATKLFGTNYLSPSSINYTGPLTRTSTIDSAELEAATRQNYLIVPSYSEAILLDPLQNNYPLRTEFRFRNEPLRACNESTIVSNYGAIGAEDEFEDENGNRAVPLSGSFATRSRSMSFSLNRNRPPPQSTASRPLPRPSQLHPSFNNAQPSLLRQPSRSISIAGTIYDAPPNRTPVELDDRRPLIRPPPPLNEPPPPYEVALRMCAPIYQRIRQSANSISSLLNALSRSNSKDLRQYSMDGPKNNGI